jgi:hypothetical protein
MGFAGGFWGKPMWDVTCGLSRHWPTTNSASASENRLVSQSIYKTMIMDLLLLMSN